MSQLRRVKAWPGLTLPIACSWFLGLLCFSLPGREGPDNFESVDFVALLKVGLRLLSIAALGGLVLRVWNHPKRVAVFTCMSPLWAFFFWSVLSAAWSPMKAVSIGQASGLCCMLLLATCVAILWRDERDTSLLLMNFCAALLMFSSTILFVDLFSHEVSGLQRHDLAVEANAAVGIMHPTTSGATAALGLLLIVAARVLWGWKWTKYLIWPSVPIHLLLMVFASSRTALGAVAVSLGLLFFAKLRPQVQAGAILLMAILGTAIMLVDPAMHYTGETVDKFLAYLSREESAEQLTSLTGRTELWDAIWKEFAKSPFIGHGYFVTSETGNLDVWGGPANHSAHNAVLQVMVSTGLIGTILFFCGLAYPIWLALISYFAKPMPAATSPRPDTNLMVLFLLIAIWYAIWAQLSVSFMGAIQPETVLFYTAFGLMIAQVRPELAIARRWAGVPIQTASGAQ